MIVKEKTSPIRSDKFGRAGYDADKGLRLGQDEQNGQYKPDECSDDHFYVRSLAVTYGF
jgi:hypothetical protein